MNQFQFESLLQEAKHKNTMPCFTREIFNHIDFGRLTKKGLLKLGVKFEDCIFANNCIFRDANFENVILSYTNALQPFFVRSIRGNFETKQLVMHLETKTALDGRNSSLTKLKQELTRGEYEDVVKHIYDYRTYNQVLNYKPSQDQLDCWLEKHYVWIDSDNKEGECFVHPFTDFSGLTFIPKGGKAYSDLRMSDLSYSNFDYHQMKNINLTHCDTYVFGIEEIFVCETSGLAYNLKANHWFDGGYTKKSIVELLNEQPHNPTFKFIDEQVKRFLVS